MPFSSLPFPLVLDHPALPNLEEVLFCLSALVRCPCSRKPPDRLRVSTRAQQDIIFWETGSRRCEFTIPSRMKPHQPACGCGPFFSANFFRLSGVGALSCRDVAINHFCRAELTFDRAKALRRLSKAYQPDLKREVFDNIKGP